MPESQPDDGSFVHPSSHDDTRIAHGFILPPFAACGLAQTTKPRSPNPTSPRTVYQRYPLLYNSLTYKAQAQSATRFEIPKDATTWPRSLKRIPFKPATLLKPVPGKPAFIASPNYKKPASGTSPPFLIQSACCSNRY